MADLPNVGLQSILSEMKPRGPRSEEELVRMLSMGMGRAALYLLKQDLSRYRDLILEHCLHNHAWDRYVEGTRADYLYPLLDASGEKDWYRTSILRALPATTDECDVEQLLDFAVIFARQGDENARDAIYETFRRSSLKSEPVGHEQVIALDGVRGLVSMLDHIGGSRKLKRWIKSRSYIIRDTEHTSSTEEVRAALATAKSESANVAAALANMEYSPDWTAEEILSRREESMLGDYRRRAETVSEATTWEEVKNHPDWERLLGHWSRVASDEEFQRAAADVDPKGSPRKLKTLLQMFDKRRFPLEPDRLIRLVDHPDQLVGARAVGALELLHGDEVRGLFDRLRNDHEWAGRAVGLLRSNYRNGDDQPIIQLLDTESDLDRLHLMCTNTMDVYRDNPSPEGLQPLLLVYEKTPCSMCRWHCFDTIRDIYGAPAWMVEECRYDASEGARELAASLKNGSKPDG